MAIPSSLVNWLVKNQTETYNPLLPYIIPIHKAVDNDELDDIEFAEALYLGHQVRAARQ